MKLVLARPPCVEETQHKVRMFYGVGLRPKIWKEFVTRFKVNHIFNDISIIKKNIFQIPHIVEMYGSTEGTAVFLNPEDKIGAIGFISQLFPLLPTTLIKLDKDGNFGLRFVNWLTNNIFRRTCERQ